MSPKEPEPHELAGLRDLREEIHRLGDKVEDLVDVLKRGKLPERVAVVEAQSRETRGVVKGLVAGVLTALAAACGAMLDKLFFASR